MINAYVLIAFVAFLGNIPCGYIRQNCPKFSTQWFFWIHVTIPFVIYLRITLGTSPWFIPPVIFLAVVGQVIGGRLRRMQTSDDEMEKLQQIPLLNEPETRTISDEEILVALLNMGGPKTNDDVEDFQRRLFSDSLLIRFPMSWAFQKLFAKILIAFRTKATKERYQLIGGGSPIFEATKAQAQALQRELNQRGRSIKVTFSFNYSRPLPDETINEAKTLHKKYLLPLSLYPHYSKATTGSNMHYLKQAARNTFPDLQFIRASSYHLHDAYIRAFCDRIQTEIENGETLDDFYLLFSAHGLPLYFLTEGDPYPFQISQTVAKVLGRLNRDERWAIAYQSAVGPLQWLKPSTEDMLSALARRNIKKIIVVPISFVTDHIETTCEIDIEYRAFAEKLGIFDFRMSKALECHSGFIAALADTVENALNGNTVNKRPSPEAQFPTPVV